MKDYFWIFFCLCGVEVLGVNFNVLCFKWPKVDFLIRKLFSKTFFMKVVEFGDMSS